MRRVLQILSWISLAATIASSILFVMDRISLDQSKLILGLATVVWFVATPLWMGRPKVDKELVN